MMRCKLPTVQTAFCGHSIFSSCVFMAWLYLAVDIFMLLAALVLVILIGMQNEGEGIKTTRYTTGSFSPNKDWMTQLRQLTLSYSFTNLLMCITWLVSRCGLLLGLYKESAFVLFFWCCLSIILMILQLSLAVALVVLLSAAVMMGDIPFIVGCALILIQLLLYVDAHMYLTLVAYSVKEAIRKRKRIGVRRFSGRFSRASFGIKKPIPQEPRKFTVTENI